MSRPGFGESAPVADIALESDGTYEGEMGNPDLEPYEATNLDISVERYSDNGAVSLGFFRKDIDNAIYPQLTQGVVAGYNFS